MVKDDLDLSNSFCSPLAQASIGVEEAGPYNNRGVLTLDAGVPSTHGEGQLDVSHA